MAIRAFSLFRLEGTAQLLQDDAGAIRLAAGRLRRVESLLRGRNPLEAIYLTQQICADSGVSHALAAALAIEALQEREVPHNGRLLRDLLHVLSLVHAHLHHFYVQALPDYLPPSALGDYVGPFAEVRSLATGVRGKAAGSWAKVGFPHPFSAGQVDRMSENRLRAGQALSRLQGMMALLGGKFPAVMSIVPGGMTTAFNKALVLKLRRALRELTPFVSTAPLEDGMLLLEKLKALRERGQGNEDLISVGSLGEDASLFPVGVVLGGSLETWRERVSETVENAYYRIPLTTHQSLQVAQEAPQKKTAYSWVKSPRYRSRSVETGALARLLITNLAGSREHTAFSMDLLRRFYGPALEKANTVGGRMLARLGELAPLLARCALLLEELVPEQPVIDKRGDGPGSGSATGRIESPAGALSHRVVVEKGHIAHYDIISASTWNGAPQDESGKRSGLETALNADGLDLNRAEDLRYASQIVHSYFFSASDAVH